MLDNRTRRSEKADPDAFIRLPEFARRWNELVPHGPPVDRWSAKRDGPRLKALLAEPDFVANFEEILRKAEAIHAGDEGAKWMSFRWLWREKDGVPNWWLLLNGQHDWMANKGKHGKPTTTDVVAEAIRRIDEEVNSGKYA